MYDHLSENEKALVQFSDATAQISFLTLVSRSTHSVDAAKRRKIWTRYFQESREPIAQSFQALRTLAQSADPELRKLAERCIGMDDAAKQQLRRLGNRIKQDQYA